MDRRRDLIEVVAYDAGWPASFETQRLAVESAVRHRLVASVEHIGSTSVPRLPAKPIVDMLARVEDVEDFAPALGEFEPLGWVPAPEPGDADGRRWSLCFPGVERRTHHLHVIEESSTGWPDWLLFRDFLRAHSDAAAQYADLKRRLAAADHHDRAAYRAGKAPLIDELMAAARVWAATGR